MSHIGKVSRNRCGPKLAPDTTRSYGRLKLVTRMRKDSRALTCTGVASLMNRDILREVMALLKLKRNKLALGEKLLDYVRFVVIDKILITREMVVIRDYGWPKASDGSITEPLRGLLYFV